MEYEIVALEERHVAGLSARTSNADPQMGAVIGGLWERFFDEGVYAAIVGKSNSKALGIYTDYSGDETGEYTVMVACETGAGAMGEGISVRTIPAGRYARFVARGEMHEAVAGAWQEIWKMDLPRAFACDFEEYQNDSMEDAEIHIYISLLDGEDAK